MKIVLHRLAIVMICLGVVKIVFALVMMLRNKIKKQ